MDELRLRILTDGTNLGNGILKVNGFINHQVDPRLMDACGRALAQRFARVEATKVLTAEISGIAPALTPAPHPTRVLPAETPGTPPALPPPPPLGLPVVSPRKSKPVPMPDQILRA